LGKVQTRLHLPLAIFKPLLLSNHLLTELPKLKGSKPSAWINRLEDIPLIAIYAVYLLTGLPPLEKYAINWRFIHPIADGHELRKRGLAPGPEDQKILGLLRTAWADGEIKSKSQENELIKKMVRERNSE
jgi:hypothetical protein